MKEYQYVVTVPVHCSTDTHNQDAESLKKLSAYITEGYVVTHITSSAVDGNMFVYHWLEKETK
jgi:hypothetical protein